MVTEALRPPATRARVWQGARLLGRSAQALLTILAITLAAFLAALPVLGKDVYVVTGASMEPTIPMGSLIVVDRATPGSLQPGDIITFTDREAGALVTHRVSRLTIEDTGLVIRTQGDNNAVEDAWTVAAGNVVGKTVAWLPLLGYAVGYAASPEARVLVLGLLVLAFVVSQVRHHRRPRATPAPA